MVEKVLVILGVLLGVWVMYPHIRAGKFIAPTPIAAGTWMAEYFPEDTRTLLATPPQGYGWYHFDFWNNPPVDGRPVYKDDFKL